MYKHLFILFCCFCCGMLSAQQRVKTVPEQITLFANGAQVTRTQTITVPAGESVISFTGLSPHLDAKSIQVRAKGYFTVTGVNHRFNHLDSLERSRQLQELERKCKETDRKLKEVQAAKEVTVAEEELLKVNCSVSNRNTGTSLVAIKELNDYYASRLLELRKKLLAWEEEQKELEKVRQQLQQEIDEWGVSSSRSSSEITVKVDAPSSGKGTFTLTYYVKNAGWYPSYDIRAEGLARPMVLSYKANVFQNSGEDWKEVKLTLSSSNPNLSNVVPQLRTYWLDFGLAAPNYRTLMAGSTVAGIVKDQQNEPLIGACVRVEGSTVATVTDVDGRYSITLPEGKSDLVFSYIGFETQTLRATGNTLNVVLKEDRHSLQEVMVTGELQGKVAGVATRNGKQRYGSEEEDIYRADAAAEESAVIEVEQLQNLLGYEFDIQKPQTILSDGKTVATEIGRYELSAGYYYRSTPRADKDAFLVADVTGWNNLNLLEGEANIYFENSYVGKSVLNPHLQGDTLHFSLGRDSGIRIQRTKQSDYAAHKLVGASKVQTIAWKTEIQNARREAVELVLQDQLPVSRNSSITVTAEELSGGNLDETTGIVIWKLSLQPGEQKELSLRYKVKYPKGRRLDVE